MMSLEMPTYAYACTECGHKFDAVQSFSEDSLTVCPECDGALRKQFGAVGVVFKGGGFYKTDSRSDAGSGSNGSGSKGADAGSGSNGSGSDGSGANGSGSTESGSNVSKGAESGASAGSSASSGASSTGSAASTASSTAS